MKTQTINFMRKFFSLAVVISALTFVSCNNDDDTPASMESTATCNDGIQNQGETGVDCGGPNCQPCVTAIAPSCTDGIQNAGETGIDCGGTCPNLCPGSSIEVTESISEDTTWSADFVYELKGRIFVDPGATLTIEPGVIIKAEVGSGANASTLVVARGATLVANGTADAPIIFTAFSDNIAFGETAGTNLDQNNRGQWGGLVVLGNAPVSLDGEATEAQIEGIPASDTRGLYGGNDPADGGGTILNYISIRHGGTALSDGNELNGLTLGAVGSGAMVSNIEVVANDDDGIEFFGGTVNATNLFVWAQADDAIDIDQAYSGNIDNVVVVQGGTSDHALEIDGPEGSLQGAFTLNNVTLFGMADSEDRGQIADFRDGAQGTITNVLVTGFTGIGEGLVFGSVELDNDGVAENYTSGILSFANWEVVLPAGVESAAEIFEDRSDIGSTFETDAATFSTAVTTETATVGADTSVFAWTYSNFKAELGF